MPSGNGTGNSLESFPGRLTPSHLQGPAVGSAERAPQAMRTEAPLTFAKHRSLEAKQAVLIARRARSVQAQSVG